MANALEEMGDKLSFWKAQRTCSLFQFSSVIEVLLRGRGEVETFCEGSLQL